MAVCTRHGIGFSFKAHLAMSWGDLRHPLLSKIYQEGSPACHCVPSARWLRTVVEHEPAKRATTFETSVDGSARRCAKLLSRDEEGRDRQSLRIESARFSSSQRACPSPNSEQCALSETWWWPAVRWVRSVRSARRKGAVFWGGLGDRPDCVSARAKAVSPHTLLDGQMGLQEEIGSRVVATQMGPQ